MNGYLFDTSALSAYLNEQHPHHETARERINAISKDALRLVSVVTLAEIDYGIRFAENAGSTRLTEYRDRLGIIRNYTLLNITHHTSEAYGNYPFNATQDC